MKPITIDILNSFFNEGNEDGLADVATIDHPLTVLAHLDFIIPDLYQLLQASSIITEAISFDMIAPVLTHDEHYFRLPENLRKNVRERTAKLQFPSAKLASILEVYYTQRIDAQEIDIDGYKHFYRALISFNLQRGGDGLCNFLLKYTEKLFYNGEYRFLSPLISRAYDKLNNQEKSTELNRITLAVVVTWLSVFNYNDDEYERARNASKSAISLFKNIKPSNDELKELCDHWYSRALVQKGELDNDINDYVSAISNYEQAIKKFSQISYIRKLFTQYLTLGLFDSAEATLIRIRRKLDNPHPDESADILAHSKASLKYDVGRYYLALGFYKEAAEMFESTLDVFKQYPDWHTGSRIHWSLSVLQDAFFGKKKVAAAKANKALETLRECSRISDQFDPSILIFTLFWLTRFELLNNNIEEAWANYQKGYTALVKNMDCHRREYFEYQFTYRQFQFSDEEMSIQSVSGQDILKLLANYYPQPLADIFVTINPYFNLVINEPLISEESRAAVIRLINPEIRTAGLELRTDTDQQLIINRLRTESGLILPNNDKLLAVELYKLPFYKTYELLKVTIQAPELKIIRYLFCSETEMVSMDKSNEAILNIGETDMNITSHQDALLYIRFYFDSVEGRHGRFYILNGNEDEIPWDANKKGEGLVEHEQKIQTLDRQARFLFEEVKDGVRYWNFDSKVLFKNAVFSSKIELNVEKGKLDFYRETVSMEDLPFSVDLRSAMDFTGA